MSAFGWAIVVLLAVGQNVVAQPVASDPSETARVRWGSFSFTPAIFVTGGYDSNVTRESDAIPDWELVTSPQLEAWFSLGRVLLNDVAAVELTNHRQDPPVTFNYYNGIFLSVPGAVLEPRASYSHVNLYARPTGFEIGERSRRVEDDITGSLNWTVGSRTTLSAEARRLYINWDGAADYQGSNLREFLNRTSTTGSFSAGIQATPLTSFFARAQVIRDRFEFSPERDGDSIDVLAGVTLSSPALISGSGMVGYRRFQSRTSGVADFNGVVYMAQLAYVRESTSGVADFNGVVYMAQLAYVRESRTRILLDLDRQPFYSYSESLGYYLLTSTSGAYVQSLFKDWETSVFGGYHLLDYRVAGLAAGDDSTTRRTDVGAGVSRRVGAYTRIGVNCSYALSRGLEQWSAWRAITYIVYGSDRLKRLDRPLPDER